MILINVLAFVVLKNCTISFLCKNIYLQITADISKISENFKGNIAFILNLLSEIANVFA